MASPLVRVESSFKNALARCIVKPPPGESVVPMSQDKMLFTPGPLTTSLAVKQAMLRDTEFIEIVRDIRNRLLRIAGTTADCFRTGTIGRIFPPDVEGLLSTVHRVLAEMNVPLPLAALEEDRT